MKKLLKKAKKIPKYALVSKGIKINGKLEFIEAISINSGPYRDIIYRYGKCNFAEEPNQDGMLNFSFQYDILFNPKKLDTSEKKFINTIGDILLDLVAKQLQQQELIRSTKEPNGNNDDSRENNTEESDLQQRIHEESPTIRKGGILRGHFGKDDLSRTEEYCREIQRRAKGEGDIS